MADDKPRFRPIAAIVCDDVRRESNGKEILIGVYTSDLLLQRMPAQIKLCVHLIGELTTRPGLIEFQMRIDQPDKNTLVTAKSTVEVEIGTKKHEHVGISSPPFPIVINEPGDLFVRFRQGEDRWKIVKVLPVRLIPQQDGIEKSSDLAERARTEQERPS